MSQFDTVVTKLIPNLAEFQGSDLTVTTPIDGSTLATLRFNTSEEIEAIIAKSQAAFHAWREVPGCGGKKIRRT